MSLSGFTRQTSLSRHDLEVENLCYLILVQYFFGLSYLSHRWPKSVDGKDFTVDRKDRKEHLLMPGQITINDSSMPRTNETPTLDEVQDLHNFLINYNC
jgi:hypothetical protein